MDFFDQKQLCVTYNFKRLTLLWGLSKADISAQYCTDREEGRFLQGSLIPITAAKKMITKSTEHSHVRLKALTSTTRQFLSFHGRYHKSFQRHTLNIPDRACQYLKGLFPGRQKEYEANGGETG